MDSGREYWVEISQGEKRLGAGFLLTPCYVVTASHCLRNVTTANESLDISLPGGEIIPGRLYRRSVEADLALIDIATPGGHSAYAPMADRAVSGEEWRNPYRPSTGHAYLTGRVSAPELRYRCEGEGTIEAMQLECSQDLGDYSGYSGSPIERGGPANSPAVLGLLIEQYPDQNPAHRTAQRSSAVLFAATVAEILRRFDCFSVGHLLPLLPPVEGVNAGETRAMTAPSPPPSRSRIDGSKELEEYSGSSTDRRIRSADAKLRALHEWQRLGLIDELQVSPLKLRIIESLLDGDS